jgi:hypothetical protein
MERSITVQEERRRFLPIITVRPSESSGFGMLLLLEQVPQHFNKPLISTGRFSQDMFAQ